MGLIKEPLNVDFYFDGRQMTDEDQQRVSAFIAAQKKRSARRTQNKPSTGKKKLSAKAA